MPKTNIEWLRDNPYKMEGVTWNPVTGCSPISPGCKHCWAKTMAETRLRGRCGYDQDDPFKVTFHPDRLDQPLRWRKPRMVFISSMGDLFHDDVLYDWFEEIMGTIEITNAADKINPHIFIFLTKRPKRMAGFFNLFQKEHSVLPQNLWLGTSVEDQATADERIDILRQIPTAVRFISYEPALGLVDFRCKDCNGTGNFKNYNELGVCFEGPCMSCDETGINWRFRQLDWVIAGSETGPNARPSDPDWYRKVRDDCRAAAVPFFFKGMKTPGGKTRLLDGVEHSEFPEVKR